MKCTQQDLSEVTGDATGFLDFASLRSE